MLRTARLVHCALALVACFFASAAAAQAYPVKPIRFILPFPPGGGTDILGRVLAQELNKAVGQPVVPENRPGAGGNVGAEYASKSAPDGYTIVLSAPSLAISPTLYRKLNYDAVRDLAPIGLVANIPNVIVVHPVVPAMTLKELVALSRAQPGKLNFGTGGAGTSNDLAAQYFKAENKLDMVIVPHKGANQAMLALLGGQVDIVVIGVAAAAPHVKAGKLRALATLGKARVASLPDAPTVIEAGMPWFLVDTWYGVLAPAGTPRPVIDRLNGEFGKILRAPEVIERLAGIGVEPLTSTPDEFAAFIRSEIERWGKVVKQSGARAD
jgi:tripartite-type tricarboxylate transporter receptor subunit TctC